MTGCKWKRETEDTEIPENFYGIQTTPHLDSQKRISIPDICNFGCYAH